MQLPTLQCGLVPLQQTGGGGGIGSRSSSRRLLAPLVALLQGLEGLAAAVGGASLV